MSGRGFVIRTREAKIVIGIYLQIRGEHDSFAGKMSTAVRTLTEKPKDSIPHVGIGGNFPLDEAIVAGPNFPNKTVS